MMLLRSAALVAKKLLVGDKKKKQLDTVKQKCLLIEHCLVKYFAFLKNVC